MKASTRTEPPRPRGTAAPAPALVSWVGWVTVVAATLTACGGGGTHATAAPTTGASPATSAGSAGPTVNSTVSSTASPASASASRAACVARQHPNHAATHTRTHTSKLLQYQIDYPAGWRLTTACRPWRYGELGDQDIPGTMDTYQSPGRPAFVVTSQRIPARMSVAKYLPVYMNGQPTDPFCWPDPPRWPVLHIAGHVARLRGHSTYCDVTEAVTVVGDRAYVFDGDTNRHGCCLFNQARFDAFLASVKFPTHDSQPQTPPLARLTPQMVKVIDHQQTAVTLVDGGSQRDARLLWNRFGDRGPMGQPPGEPRLRGISLARVDSPAVPGGSGTYWVVFSDHVWTPSHGPQGGGSFGREVMFVDQDSLRPVDTIDF
jgi:hypothetical protein